MSRFRRIIQTLFLCAFFGLMVATAKQVELSFQTHLFLAADPLVAAASLFSGQVVILTIALSAIMIVVSILFGRIFCGYACPLGTLIDLFAPLEKIPELLHLKRYNRSSRYDRRNLRDRPDRVSPANQANYYKPYISASQQHPSRKPQHQRLLRSFPLLTALFLLLSSAFGVSLFMILDPIVLLTRISAAVLFPLINSALNRLMDVLYLSEKLIPYADATALKLSGILIFSEARAFESATWITLVFVVVIGLNLLGSRFWCRYICPLGGLLGLLGRAPLYRRTVDTAACTGCLSCDKACDMDAIRDNGRTTDGSRCTLCMACRKTCKQKAISHGFKTYLVSELPSRRSLIATLSASAAVAFIVPFEISQPNDTSNQKDLPRRHPYLIRPPGALKKNDFLDACTRCGECLKVCPSNTIQPAILQYGAESLWTPHLVFSSGACEYGCNECSKVCPTGAIQDITLAEKQKQVIGVAQINRKICIPWVSGHTCMVCQELCPLPKKAIEFKQTEELRQSPGSLTASKPYVVEKRCIGCGICEKHCPVAGKKAIRITDSDN